MDLETLFGSDICVTVQPRNLDRQYAGFAGAVGVTTMNLGTRGRQLVVTGRLSAAGASYNAARVNLQAAINAIELYLTAAAANYTYKTQTFYNVIFDRFSLRQGAFGKSIHFTAEGNATAEFICFLRELI